MEEKQRIYACIDLKSFYASVECVERDLDPLTTNLVVADQSRTSKTICLAVSPSLKAYGISGRARLYEVEQRVEEVNKQRKIQNRYREFRTSSYNDIILKNDRSVSVDYIVAPPRMKFYMDYSARIYKIYLKYLAPEDIHVYSVDEVFLDLTNYLNTYKKSAHELVMTMIRDVLKTTGITATGGIGTNLFLAKVAMDVVAKHIPADKDGVRIAELDVRKYRELLWDYQPITDIWRIGRGIAARLEKYSIHTLGELARFSIDQEAVLFKEFGINAELLIDHAWGYEPATIKDIKSYIPENHSMSIGQVLSEPYDFHKGLLIVKEMADLLGLDMVDKHMVTDQIVLSVGYDIANLKGEYEGEVVKDYYGRNMPKGAHGSLNLELFTSSSSMIMEGFEKLYRRIVDRHLSIRRVYVVASHAIREEVARQKETESFEQLDLFTDEDVKKKADEDKREQLKKEKEVQKAILTIKQKYGKNAVLKGLNYEDGATTRIRNRLVGGHKE